MQLPSTRHYFVSYRRYPKWLLVENVQFMLQLGRGDAMRHIVSELESMNMRWAYCVVDSSDDRVPPKRRRRAIPARFKIEDPCSVLFADDAGERPESDFADDAYGSLHWTEGLRGSGWERDQSHTGRPCQPRHPRSPPAIWIPRRTGRRLIVPSVEDGEAMQGFERDGLEQSTVPVGRSAMEVFVGNAVNCRGRSGRTPHEPR